MKQQGIGWHEGVPIVRRGLFLAGALLLASALLFPVEVLRARTRKPVCPGGRFLVTSGPLLASNSALEPLVISGAQASIGRACPPAFAKLTGTRRGQVKLRVTWPTCAGIVGKAQLKGTISADCASIGGTFVVRKSHIRKTFSAQRSACGDGLLDGEGGEQCDGGAGCGRGETCFTCACFPEGQVPTTTTTTLPPVSFSAQVQPILTARCATPLCHSGAFPQQGLDLQAGQSHAELVNANSVQCTQKRVAPGAPDQSYLMTKLAGSGPCLLGDRMPASRALGAADVNTIRTWIAEGARGN